MPFPPIRLFHFILLVFFYFHVSIRTRQRLTHVSPLPVPLPLEDGEEGHRMNRMRPLKALRAEAPCLACVPLLLAAKNRSQYLIFTPMFPGQCVVCWHRVIRQGKWRDTSDPRAILNRCRLASSAPSIIDIPAPPFLASRFSHNRSRWN